MAVGAAGGRWTWPRLPAEVGCEQEAGRGCSEVLLPPGPPVPPTGVESATHDT